MFEQSILLDSVSGKKAGAMAVSLATQTAAVGTLLLIPLIYMERLPLVQLPLTTFLPIPLPPHESPKPAAAQPQAERVARSGRIFVPRSVPRLGTRPEIVIDAPGADLALGALDPGIFVAPAPSLPQLIPPPRPVVVIETVPPRPLTVTSEVQAAKLLRKVVPVYPRLALIARVSGTVRLIGTIGKEGTIGQLQVISGTPLLVQAAVDAVRQWVYRPTLLNGKPVEVIAPIDVIFTLSQ